MKRTRFHWLKSAIAGSLLLILHSFCFGHPDLLEQISRITARLENDPQNCELYLQRADLRRCHSEYKAAEEDLACAKNLGAATARTLSLEAQILFDQGRTDEAQTAVQRSLQIEPRQPGLLTLRARWLARSRRMTEAVRDFTAAISLSGKASPDLFLERARAQAEMGSLDEAVAGLDDGMRLLGAIPSLEVAAIDYERRQKHLEGALGRLAGMIRRYPLKEPWLALRGELLEESGRYSEAEAAYVEVVQGLEKYPPYRRNVLLNKELSERAREGLRRVKERRTTQTVSKPEAER